MFNRKRIIELEKKIAACQEEHLRLLEEKHKLQYENNRLRHELDDLKPILENPQYEPPKSKECQDCIYAVRSNRDHAVIACRKNALCEDFKAKDDA
jgi:regulator of replication initiation timing